MPLQEHRTPSQRRPSIGRIVHFVYPDKLDSDTQEKLERPGIIVRVWSDTCVQLQVFTDGSNDGEPNVAWKTSVVYDEGKRGYSWHWPEFV